MAWPAPGPNRATGKAGARAIWFGRGMILQGGPAPDPSLAEHAALTDQTDGWACVQLEGQRRRRCAGPADTARPARRAFSSAATPRARTCST